MVAPKLSVGSNLKNLHTMNTTFLMKLTWKIISQKHLLWVRVMCAKRGFDGMGMN